MKIKALVAGIVIYNLITISYLCFCSITFSKNCTNWLNLAAKANSVEIASKRLNTAIDYLEKNNLTSGSTHILWGTPLTDLELWTQNLKSAQTELNTVLHKNNATELEKSNILLKLHETLTGEKGAVFTPANIALYPTQVLFYVLLSIGLLPFILLVFIGASMVK